MKLVTQLPDGRWTLEPMPPSSPAARFQELASKYQRPATLFTLSKLTGAPVVLVGLGVRALEFLSKAKV